MLDAEMMFYKAAVISDASGNGGVMGITSYTSGLLADVFPHVLKAERVTGSTKYRKVHVKNTNDDDEALISPQLWFDVPTPADDYAMIFVGTESDTQDDITGSERKYGVAALSTDATIALNTLIVTVEHVDQIGMFVNGDTIRVTDMTDPLDGGTGNEEFHVINGVPSVSSLEITITTTDPLTYGYLVASTTRVSSVYEPATIEGSVDNWVETGAGTYDETGYPIVLDNISTIAQEWTITFLAGGATFTVEGDTVGFLASGAIGTDYAENNTDFSKPYFTLDKDGWGGTWTTDDTIVFQTHPASSEIWEMRVVPAGCASLSGDQIVLVIAGESA